MRFGLVDGDRQLKPDLRALALEVGVRPDLDLDQGIARTRAGGTGIALALEANGLALLDSRRDSDVQGLAGRQADASRGAESGVEKIDRDLEGPIAALADPAAVALAAARKDVGELAKDIVGAAATEAEPAAAPGAARIFVTEAPLFLPAGVDFTAIEAAPLGAIAQQRVGGRNLLEVLRHLGIVVVDVGMQLLGESPVGTLDLVLLGASGDAQDLVGPWTRRSGCNQVFPWRLL